MVGAGSIERRAGGYAVLPVFQMSAALVSVPLLTFLMEPVKFGQLAVTLVACQVVGLLLSLGLPTAILLTFFDHDRRPQAERLVYWSALGAAFVASVLAISLVYLGPVIGSANLLVTGCAVSASFAAFAASQSWLRASGAVGGYVTYGILSSAGGPIIGLLVMWSVDPEPVLYLLGILSANACAFLLGLRQIRIDSQTSLPSPRRPLPLSPRWIFAVSIPAGAHVLAMYAIASGDRFLIGHMLGTEAVARYQVAYLGATAGVALLGAVNNAWSPMLLASPSRLAFSAQLRTTSSLLYAFTGALLALYVCFGPAVVGVLFPVAYHAHRLPVVIALLGPSLYFYAGFMSTSQVFLYEHRMGPLAWCAPSAIAVGLVANILLIPARGLSGAALASSMAYATLFGVSVLMVSFSSLHAGLLRSWIRYGALPAAVTLLAGTLDGTSIWPLLRPTLVAIACAPAYISWRATKTQHGAASEEEHAAH